MQSYFVLSINRQDFNWFNTEGSDSASGTLHSAKGIPAK